jgi:hypothetical protein
LYKNVLKTNNLGFVNFSEMFNEISYQKPNESIILVGLIEFQNINIPINSINYFFYEYNEENNKPTKIDKENILNNSTLKLKVEYPIYNFINPNISDTYSSNLIDTIKTLNILDQSIDFFNEKSEFYSDICTTFTSEIGTDMTIADRTASYSIKLSLCENGCQLITLIDKGKNENPRAVCECEFKNDSLKNDDSYTFIYEKIDGKNVSNFNALKCGKNVFKSKEIQNNFIFWIFIFLIFILAIILLSIIFCGKSTVEDILKITKVVEVSESNKSKDNIYDFSEKISSVHSDEKYQSIDIKESKSNLKGKEIISSKISYAAPPPKRKIEFLPSKTDNHLASRTHDNSMNTTFNFNNKYDIKIKNQEDMLDEIFPDYNEVLNNNYYENKYMKNNYINLRLTSLKLKKYFVAPLGNDEIIKHNNTDSEDNTDDFDYFKFKNKRRTMFNYYQKLLPEAEIFPNIVRNNYKKQRYKTEYNDINKNIALKNRVKFFEETDYSGDARNQTILVKSKEKTKLSIINSILNENRNIEGDLIIHKKKKSSLSSNNNDDKNSDKSSARSISKSDSMDKYFLNSSMNNNNYKFKYTFPKFYWIYLNKREFCLMSIYNIQDNVAPYIRISTFIFVISLFITINCLFLTSNHIHERYLYKKEKGSLNEFTYIFKKEAGTLFIIIVIYIVIKIVFIKFIYGKLFRISYSAKEELSPFGNLESEKEESGDKNTKRKNYLKKYTKRGLIYIIILLVLMFFMGYISVCYFGIFKNTKINMIIRFIIAFIFSIIICAILCLIIVIIYHFGRKKKNKCLKGTYKILNLIY